MSDDLNIFGIVGWYFTILIALSGFINNALTENACVKKYRHVATEIPF